MNTSSGNGKLGNRVLITGCEGFIGSHVAEFLVGMGLSVYGTVFQNTGNIDHLGDKLNVRKCNVTDRESVRAIVEEVRPDYVFHLAAQSLILASWQDMEKTFNINVMGTIHLLDCIRAAGLDPVIEFACSSDEYDYADADGSLTKESDELCPSSPYGISKLAEDMLGLVCWQVFGTKVIRIRPFSVVGPRKVSDACSDFARDIAGIEAGKRANLSVGNLDAVRDFLDIEDAVKAMWLLAEKGAPGQVYNICSGKGSRIGDVLDKLIAISAHQVEVRPDPSRMRLSDKPFLVGDNSKLRELGWEPTIPLEDTLTNILNYWRANT